MPYLAAVTNRDSSMILKMATSIDEHSFAYGNVLSEIRI